MTCPYCGAENDAGFQFCKSCGTKLPPKAAPQQPQYQAPQYQPPQQPQYQAPQYQAPQYQAPQYQPQAPVAAPVSPKKNPFDSIIAKVKAIDFKALLKEPKKLIVPAAAVAAVLVLIILISVVASAGGNETGIKHINYMLSVDDGDETLYLRDGKLVESGLEGNTVSYTQSIDGSVLVYVVDDEEVFVTRGKDSVSITDEAEQIVLSQDGNTMAVIDEDGVLFLYNTKNGEATEIAEDVQSVTLSPNGKNAAYTVYDDEVMAYYWDGKESIELDEELSPLALSDGGKYIYCYNDDKETLEVWNKKGDSEKIASDLSTYYDFFYLNKDHTQIVFRADGKWYASVKGGEKIKLTSDSSFNILSPWGNGSSFQFLGDVFVVTLNNATLTNCFVEMDDALYYMDKNWETEKVAKDVENAILSRDGSTVVYLKDNGKLYKATAKKPGDSVELAEDVVSFDVTSDCSAVYYINEDEELMYQKGTKEAKQIGDDVEQISMTFDDYCLFLCDYSGNSGTLYATRNGSKKEKITDECYDFTCALNATYLWTDYDDGDFNFSVATKGTKFKAIYEY